MSLALVLFLIGLGLLLLAVVLSHLDRPGLALVVCLLWIFISIAWFVQAVGDWSHGIAEEQAAHQELLDSAEPDFTIVGREYTNEISTSTTTCIPADSSNCSTQTVTVPSNWVVSIEDAEGVITEHCMLPNSTGFWSHHDIADLQDGQTVAIYGTDYYESRRWDWFMFKDETLDESFDFVPCASIGGAR